MILTTIIKLTRFNLHIQLFIRPQMSTQILFVNHLIYTINDLMIVVNEAQLAVEAVYVFYFRDQIKTYVHHGDWDDEMFTSAELKPEAIYIRVDGKVIKLCDRPEMTLKFQLNRQRRILKSFEVNMLEILNKKESYMDHEYYPSRTVLKREFTPIMSDLIARGPREPEESESQELAL